MRLRANLVAFGCAFAFVASIAVVLFVNFTPRPEASEPNLGFITFLWLATFFLPPFFTGRRANDQGAIYGLVIGLVPLVVAVLFGYSIPALFGLFFYAFAPIGGFLGQRFSGIRRAG